MTGSPCLICGRFVRFNSSTWCLCPACPDDHMVCAPCLGRWGLSLGEIERERHILARCPLPILDEMRVAAALMDGPPDPSGLVAKFAPFFPFVRPRWVCA